MSELPVLVRLTADEQVNLEIVRSWLVSCGRKENHTQPACCLAYALAMAAARIDPKGARPCPH